MSVHRDRGALAVIRTGLRQLDGVAALGADADLHGDPLEVIDLVAAVDRIGQRMGVAVAVLDAEGER